MPVEEKKHSNWNYAKLGVGITAIGTGWVIIWKLGWVAIIIVSAINTQRRDTKELQDAVILTNQKFEIVNDKLNKIDTRFNVVENRESVVETHLKSQDDLLWHLLEQNKITKK